jgi:hypothetical protein
MARRISIGTFLAGTLCIAAAYGSAFLPGAPAWGNWCMVAGTALVMLGALLLGAARRTKPLGMLAWVFAFMFLLVAGCLGTALLLPPEQAGSALLVGLPRRAAIVLYGLGVVPFLVLPLAYAITFDRLVIGEAELAQLRDRAAALRADALRDHADAHAVAPDTEAR